MNSIFGPVGSEDHVREKARQLSDDNLHWVANGEIVHSLDVIGMDGCDEATLLDRKGLVRLTADDDVEDTFSLVGVARGPRTEQAFREELRGSLSVAEGRQQAIVPLSHGVEKESSSD